MLRAFHHTASAFKNRSLVYGADGSSFFRFLEILKETFLRRSYLCKAKLVLTYREPY